MTIEQLVKNEVNKISDKTFTSPNIPEKKLNGALTGIAPGINPDYVIAIADTSLFGSAKEGCLFTGETMYIHAIGETRESIQLSEMDKAVHFTTMTTKKNGKTETVNHLKIQLIDGTEVDLTKNMLFIKTDQLADLLNAIAELGKAGNTFSSTSQTMPLSMMDAEIKKGYVKLVCNFAYSDDDTISPEEYAEIISLIVRIELAPADRFEIRQYMLSQITPTYSDLLLQYLKSELNEEYYSIIKKSLMKDILYLDSKTKKTKHWKDNPVITEMGRKLDIDENQIELIYDAIKNDEAILSQRKNDSEIEKSFKDIASKAASVGVPLAAIYLSGSVIGVSAAGITSGLATLGLGGLLGFSSMFTGIGIAVLLGIGTYKGLKKLTGMNDLENNKQRESMLQAIVINAQKSLNILIEDINEISRRLSEAIHEGSIAEEKIGKLTGIIGMMSRGAQVTSDRIQYAEVEKVITRLPETLDMNRLLELTSSPTSLKYREAVLACYKESTSEIGAKKVYVIDGDQPLDDLRNLIAIFDMIGYNKLADASMAAFKGATKKFMNDVVGK